MYLTPSNRFLLCVLIFACGFAARGGGPLIISALVFVAWLAACVSASCFSCPGHVTDSVTHKKD